jgi:hypothetical protein
MRHVAREILGPDHCIIGRAQLQHRVIIDLEAIGLVPDIDARQSQPRFSTATTK